MRLVAIFGLLLLPGASFAQEMELKVVLWSPLGTKTNHRGDRVSARVAQPDCFKGDEVHGTVADVQPGRHSVLSIAFDTLVHAGQSVPIGAQIQTFQNSKGRTEADEDGRSVRKVAGPLGVVQIAGDSDIRLDAGSAFLLSAQSRGGPSLASLMEPPPAPVYSAPASTAVSPPAPPPPPEPAPVAAPTPAPLAPAPAPVAPATPATPPAEIIPATPQPDFSVLKDDFLPGEKTLLYDDFTDMTPDEAPPHWKVRGTAPVLMAAKGIRQLSLGWRVSMTPIMPKIPSNFTIQTELTVDPKNGGEFNWDFCPGKESNCDALRVHMQTSGGSSIRLIAGTTKEGLIDAEFPTDYSQPIKSGIWVQNGRVRVYLNETKILDANQVEVPDLDHAIFQFNEFGEEKKVNLRFVRLAESTPDFSRSIMSTGRYITHGILFDTGSDRLKPESAPVIRSIAFGLQASPELKLRIEGHTDSSGQAAANLELSKKRAEAVKQVLVTQFEVDPSRLSTNGLGAAKPADSNDTPLGRAQNRRVEFIKQ